MKYKLKYRPKILCFLSHYFPGYQSGGPVRSILNLIEHLNNDFEFFIVTSDRDVLDDKPYSSIKIDSWNKVGYSKVYYISKSKINLKEILKIIRSTDHDILYLNSFFNFAFTTIPLIACHLLGASVAPCILAPRGEFSSAALKNKFWKKKIYLFFFKLLNLYKNLYWQASNKQELSDIFHKKNIPLNKIYIAPDLPSKFNKIKNIENKNKKKIGELNLIFLSRINPMKNLDFLLKILSKSKKKIKLSIYGPIDDRKYWTKCKKIIQALPKNINTKYFGMLTPKYVLKKISLNDIFILPSRSESFGHVIIESLIAGTPVIISDMTPWKKDKKKAITVISLKQQNKWLIEIEKFVDCDNSYLYKRRLAAKKFAESFLSNKKAINQNKKLFLRFIN